MKRKLLLGALITICLTLLVYGTLAYFTAEDEARNVITSGEISIKIFEWADDEKTEAFPEDEVTGVLPGTGLTKIVEIKNTGANSAYIRVKVLMEILLAEGSQIEPDLNLIHLDFNTSDWTPGTDGYYYYNQALEAGDTTSPLFTAVSFDLGMGNDYKNSTAKIDVKAYAVQSDNNTNSPLTALGWPAD